MRLTTYPLLLAGAGLVVHHVGAAPLRVVMVTSHQEISANQHFEPVAAVHAAATPHGMVMMHSEHPDSMNTATLQRAGRHCGGLRDGVMRLSNSIFGFPKLDATTSVPLHHEEDRVSILPFIGTPMSASVPTVDSETDHRIAGDDAAVSMPPPPLMSHGPMMHGGPRQGEMGPVRIVHMSEQDGRRMRFRHHRGPFLRRLHFALMALGPWEGRAVAFVLGCGIGVLLRMMWVLGIVMVRAISGRRSEDAAETVFDLDAEEILVPPPQYTDEKVAIATDDKPNADA
ncbi:hypothetical protein WOLCODRAFT_28229 [Wolfiporia cocos MD-104 SS10]|uniref:Copper transporter n=1 Tax=Wolfiporia cocos (strain MD-104) TaxID=742152 RepID=A0A2H3JIY3_WOLCO|nr:hypothetical protein WOLCODRAFT_28229 [Wolfiporia cocos MD-104 SS10]